MSGLAPIPLWHWTAISRCIEWKDGSFLMMTAAMTVHDDMKSIFTFRKCLWEFEWEFSCRIFAFHHKDCNCTFPTQTILSLCWETSRGQQSAKFITHCCRGGAERESFLWNLHQLHLQLVLCWCNSGYTTESIYSFMACIKETLQLIWIVCSQ